MSKEFMPGQSSAMRCAAISLSLLLLAAQATANAPSNPASYARTTAFTYEPATGRLATTTIEPNVPALCSTTTVGYDAYGNVSSSTVSNCAGATGRLKFASRGATTYFDAVPSQAIQVNGSLVNVAIPAGTVVTRSVNALTHTVKSQVDPRFGAPIRVEDPNGAVGVTEFDDFGRAVRSKAPDGTSSVMRYCILATSGEDVSSNSDGCPSVSASEIPADAVSFTHAEPRNTSDVKAGPFIRTYLDRRGRPIRVATESFDGVNQPAGRSAATVVTDTVFNDFGLKQMETGSYYLASGSANSSGANDVVVTWTEYDNLGRPVQLHTANPNGLHSASFGGAGAFAYGRYGARQSAMTVLAYSGTVTTVTDDQGRSKTIEKDAAGQEIRVTDAHGAQIAKQFDAFGLLVQTKDALQNTISISYDILGRRLSLSDPDKGVIQTCYDALGQTKASQNSSMRGSHGVTACPDNDDTASGGPIAVSGWHTFGYDVLGRLTKQIAPSDTYQWAYDTGTGAKGRLSLSSAGSGVVKAFYYDALGRALSSRINIASGPSFASAVSYDPQTGRLSSKTYPTGFQVGYSYTTLGYLSALTTQTSINLSPLPSVPGGAAASPAVIAAGEVLWSAQVLGADRRLEKSQLRSSVTTSNTYDGPGRLGNVVTLSPGGQLLNYGYGWDGLNNLVNRTDNIGSGAGAVSEIFQYDGVNRLKRYSVAAPAIPNSLREVEMQYNALGMLLSKTDVGNYSYGSQTCGAAHPHAPAQIAGSVMCYDLNGNLVSASQGKYRSLTYTENDKVLTANGPAGGPSYAWSYDAEGMRIKEVRTQGATSRTLWYLHPDAVGGLGFEREVNSASDESRNRNRHFLEVGGATVGVVVSAGALPALGALTEPPALAMLSANKLEYWHKDHLGSLVATTDHAGSVTQRYAYDPYGKRRHSDGNYDEAGNLVIDWAPDVNKGTGRGFTGHEELDDIGLINMNGRIYDDYAGLFLQADPVIKDPSSTQAYSRYTYVLNNPLNLVDPSGFEEDSNNRVYVSGQSEKSEPKFDSGMAAFMNWRSGMRNGNAALEYAHEHSSMNLFPNVAVFGESGLDAKGLGVAFDPSCKKADWLLGPGTFKPTRNRRQLAHSFAQFVEQVAEKASHFAWTIESGWDASVAAAQKDGALLDALLNKTLPALNQQVAMGPLVKLGRATKAEIEAARIASGLGPAAKGLEIAPGKFDYLFGRVSSNAHNAARSNQLALEMKRLGVPDTAAGRQMLSEHLALSAKAEGNMTRSYSNQFGNFEVRESFFMGPSGKAATFESTFQVLGDGTRRLSTVIPLH